MKIRAIFLNRAAKIRSGWRILMYAALSGVSAQIALTAYYALGGLAPSGQIREEGELGRIILLNLLLCSATLFAAFVMLRFIDRRSFAALGYGIHQRLWIEIGQGALLGFAMVTAIFVIEAIAGWSRVSWSGVEWSRTAKLGLLYFATFATAAALEEILARGYMLQALIQGTGKIAAVAITSTLFGLGHVINPHSEAFSVLNTMLAGVWLSVAYLQSRSLWLATSLHFWWNFVLAYVYGFPVSGLHASQPLVLLEESGPDWVTGGAYGPEGGVLGTAVIVLATLWILRSGHIRPAVHARALWTPQAEDAGPGAPTTNEDRET